MPATGAYRTLVVGYDGSDGSDGSRRALFVRRTLLGSIAQRVVLPLTLAYRLTSCWLPLPVGLVAWMWHRRRNGTGRRATLRRSSSPHSQPSA